MISQTQKDINILKNDTASADEREKYGLFYDEYKKFGVPGVNNDGILTIETNWNKRVGKNEYIKICVGEQSIVVLNDHLRSILKILAPLVEMEKMVTHSRRFYTRRQVVLGITASRPYRKGDRIEFAVDLPERLV